MQAVSYSIYQPLFAIVVLTALLKAPFAQGVLLVAPFGRFGSVNYVKQAPVLIGLKQMIRIESHRDTLDP